jgi:SNF2 family DNA or RNA helicase
VKVVVEKVGRRIYLRSPWAPGMPERCKSISGARWSPSAKAWTYPADLEVCRMLREEFKEDLQIGPELTQWAKDEVARERAATTMLRSSVSIDEQKAVSLPTRVRELTPEIARAMGNRPYQVPGARFLAYARTALIADEPGMGKTIQTLAAIVESLPEGGRVLVLAPKTAVSAVWLDEIDKWLEGFEPGYCVTNLVGMTDHQREEALAEYDELVKEYPNDLHFLLGNAEIVRMKSTRYCRQGNAAGCDGTFEWCEFADKHKGAIEPRTPYLFRQEWDAIICDETHKWLTNTRGKNASQVGRGMAKLRTRADGLRIAMTGTPLKGKKHNLWGTLNWLRPDVYTSKWAWVERYFVITENSYSRDIGDLLPERKESFFRMQDSIILRRTKSEIRKLNPAWMPPDKIYHDIWAPMDPKQKKAYNSIVRDAEVKLKGGMLTTMGTLSEFTRLKQFASCFGELNDKGVFVPSLPSGKFEWLLDFLEERGIETRNGSAKKGDLSEEVHKVVVASQFTKNINLWAAELVRLGIQCYVLTGDTKDADRQRYVKEFQSNDNVRVFFINTQAGGASITLDAADDIVIMDETWVPDDQIQVEDRVHRASNVEHQVHVWYVRSRETVEEGIAKLNVDKSKNNHVVMDARRGLEFARAEFAASFSD